MSESYFTTDITNKNISQNTEFICIFCKGLSKYQNITKKLDNTTLLCPYCHVDNMMFGHACPDVLVHARVVVQSSVRTCSRANASESRCTVLVNVIAMRALASVTFSTSRVAGSSPSPVS